MTDEPPLAIVSTAAVYALESTCAKSKRGAVVYSPRAAAAGFGLVGQIYGVGSNSPPGFAFRCDRSDRCRAGCGKVAVHAEERAIREVLRRGVGDGPQLHLVHVKVDPSRRGPPLDKVVAGGPPSCVTCSRTILDSGVVAFVWLLEAQEWHDEARCESCGRTTTVAQGEGTTGVCSECPAFPGSKIGGLLKGWKTVYAPDSGVWRRYTAEEFHRTTLKNLALYEGPRPVDTRPPWDAKPCVRGTVCVHEVQCPGTQKR